MALRLAFAVESGTDVRLVDALASRYELTVLARRIPDGVEISHRPALTVTVHTGPSGRLAYATWLAARLIRTRCDAVLVQGYGLAALAANLVGRLTGVTTTMLVCSPLERYYLARRGWPGRGKPFRRHELALMRLVAAVNAVLGSRYVVLSRHLAGEVRTRAKSRPVDVIPVYGVDTELYSPSPVPRSVLRSRLGLPPDGHLVFFNSRIAPEKDAETLLAATRLLIERGHDVRILHLSGGYREFLAAATAAGIAERVIARDAAHPVRELPDYYRASDLCVQASREEGLGFSPLEALACGTPVVATAVGGLRETIIPGQTGWTYPPGDASALADAIVAALSDPASAARLAAAGRELVRQRFEASSVFESLDRVLAGSR